VIWQQPAPHTTVDKGSTVTLVLASGPLLVTVDKAAYVGKPAEQVKAALTRLGLQVAEQPQPSAAPAGSVLDVAPAGQVRERTLVTLTVATAPPPAPARNGAGHDNGHGSGPKKGHD
jgi:serine/threonine-protein kinase